MVDIEKRVKAFHENLEMLEIEVQKIEKHTKGMGQIASDLKDTQKKITGFMPIMEERFADIKDEMNGLKDEVHSLKDEMNGLIEEMNGLSETTKLAAMRLEKTFFVAGGGLAVVAFLAIIFAILALVN